MSVREGGVGWVCVCSRTMHHRPPFYEQALPHRSPGAHLWCYSVRLAFGLHMDQRGLLAEATPPQGDFQCTARYSGGGRQGIRTEVNRTAIRPAHESRATPAHQCRPPCPPPYRRALSGSGSSAPRTFNAIASFYKPNQGQMPHTVSQARRQCRRQPLMLARALTGAQVSRILDSERGNWNLHK